MFRNTTAPTSWLPSTLQKSSRPLQAADRKLIFEKEPSHGDPTMCCSEKYAYPEVSKI